MKPQIVYNVILIPGKKVFLNSIRYAILIQSEVSLEYSIKIPLFPRHTHLFPIIEISLSQFLK